ncbi:MAG TPA: glycine--tRNA ligase [Armatimonadota bacterium]|nr:glycine--tRNA ligase [Armatimonadota bacterium]
MAGNKMDNIVNLCKRRGIIFPSSEIYGGIGSTWDYGPIGVHLKNNIKAAWWKSVVQERADMVGLDAAILMHPDVWKASGHVDSFADPMVDCKRCKRRFRADHLVEVLKTEEDAVRRTAEDLKDLEKALAEVMCPECGGELTAVRQFNLMFKTYMGPVEESAAVVYLRPETAQGIFVNFKNILNSTRKKLPFGIAQVGKSFRNEITPGNFIFRTREFEQMEIEYFTHPEEAEKWHKYWLEERFNWYVNLGIKRENLRLRPHGEDELAHYACACSDVEYQFPIGWSELEGIANRTDYDLRRHMEISGKDLSYFDEETQERLVPYVIEPSGGVDRTLLAFLCDAYEEIAGGRGEAGAEVEIVLRLHPRLAPIKAAVLPLVRKGGLPDVAVKLYADLRKHFMADYDEVRSIGRRYRRQDEIGTPWCATIDFQTLEDQTVTIRDRDTMEQIRISLDKVKDWIRDKLECIG